MRAVVEEAGDRAVDTTDGVRVVEDDGSWALVLPDPAEPITHVWAEARRPTRRDRPARALGRSSCRGPRPEPTTGGRRRRGRRRSATIETDARSPTGSCPTSDARPAAVATTSMLLLTRPGRATRWTTATPRRPPGAPRAQRPATPRAQLGAARRAARGRPAARHGVPRRPATARPPPPRPAQAPRSPRSRQRTAANRHGCETSLDRAAGRGAAAAAGRARADRLGGTRCRPRLAPAGGGHRRGAGHRARHGRAARRRASADDDRRRRRPAHRRRRGRPGHRPRPADRRQRGLGGRGRGGRRQRPAADRAERDPVGRGRDPGRLPPAVPAVRRSRPSGSPDAMRTSFVGGSGGQLPAGAASDYGIAYAVEDQRPDDAAGVARRRLRYAASTPSTRTRRDGDSRDRRARARRRHRRRPLPRARRSRSGCSPTCRSPSSPRSTPSSAGCARCSTASSTTRSSSSRSSANVLVAALIVYLGDQLGVGAQLSTGVVVVLGIRIFSNVAAIRRHLFQA